MRTLYKTTGCAVEKLGNLISGIYDRERELFGVKYGIRLMKAKYGPSRKTRKKQ